MLSRKIDAVNRITRDSRRMLACLTLISLSLCTLLITVGCPSTNSTSPTLRRKGLVATWHVTIGGVGDESPQCGIQRASGSYIIVGWTESYGTGKKDVYLLATDARGILIWQTTFGGKLDDVGYCVSETDKGDLLVLGSTCSTGRGATDVYLVKTNKQGHKLWDHTYGGPADDVGFWVVEAPDGGLLLVGSTVSLGHGSQDCYVIRTDSEGNVIWEKALGGSGWDGARWGQCMPDGSIIVVGTTESFSPPTGRRVLLLTLDSSGQLTHQSVLEGRGVDVDNAAAAILSEEQVHVCGTASSASKGFLAATDTHGEFLWRKPLRSKAFSLASRRQGGALLVGGVWRRDREEDAIAVLTDRNGNELSCITIGGKQYDRGTWVIPSGDNGYLMLGFTTSIGHGGRDLLIVALTESEEDTSANRDKCSHRDLWEQRRLQRLPLPSPKGKRVPNISAVLAAVDEESRIVVLDIRSGVAAKNDIWYVVRDGEVVSGLKINKTIGKTLCGGQIVSLKPSVRLKKGDVAVLYRFH